MEKRPDSSSVVVQPLWERVLCASTMIISDRHILIIVCVSEQKCLRGKRAIINENAHCTE